MKKITLIITVFLAACFNSSLSQDTWIQKADFAGKVNDQAVGFSIGDKGYIGTGHAHLDHFKKDFWEYDPATDTWTQKADFGGTTRAGAAGFSIGGKGYIGTGNHIPFGGYGYTNDFWEYDPSTNAWTQKANFGGTARSYATGFSIGSKGYIGTGEDLNGALQKDFWEYEPTTDVWTQIADLEGAGRWYGVGFSIGNKGYIGTGGDNGFWEYDPATNTWTQKADFGGSERYGAAGFSIRNKGYIGSGSESGNDFWEYDPASDTWLQRSDIGGIAIWSAVGFSIESKGYIGIGSGKNFWEYTPDTSSCVVPSNLAAKSITSSSAKLKWDAVPDALKYKLRYKMEGSDTWITITNISSTSKKVSGLVTNTSYTWQIKSVCSANPIVSSVWSSKREFTTGSLRMGDESLQQVSFSIYPNPAEDFVTIQFTLPQSSHVYIKINDVSGKEIEILLDADLQQGDHSFQLRTTHFSKGVYLVKMVSDSGSENRKLMVQ